MLTKSLFLKKQKVFFNSFKVLNTFQQSQLALITKKVRSKQKITKLIPFGLIAENENSLCKVQREKHRLRNRDLSICFESKKDILRDHEISTKDKVEYNNAQSLSKITPIIVNIKKELCQAKWKNYKQFFFGVNQLIESLERSNLLLLKESCGVFSGRFFYLFSLENVANCFYSNTLAQTFCKLKKGYAINTMKLLLDESLFKEGHKAMLYTAMLALASNLSQTKTADAMTAAVHIKKPNVILSDELNTNLKIWGGAGLSEIRIGQEYMVKDQVDTIKKQKKVVSILRRRTSSILKNQLYSPVVYNTNNKTALKTLLWKYNNAPLVQGTPTNITKLAQFLNKKLKYTTRQTSLQLLYVLLRIDEKLEAVGDNISIRSKLLSLQGLLIYYLGEKKKRAIENNLLLSPGESVFRSKKKTWKNNLLKSILFFLEKQDNVNKKKYQSFIQDLQTRLTKQYNSVQKPLKLFKGWTTNKENKIIISALSKHSPKALASRDVYKKKVKHFNISKQVLNNKIISNRWQKSKFTIRRTWAGSKAVALGKFTNFLQKKELLSTWAERPIALFFINTLSLSKFAFKLERIESPHNKPNRFLSMIERDFINKYKYVAVYIKDLVRIGFIAMFLKKPSFLAKFAAFQLAKLPRNRKETVFIRFLIKAIRTFAAGRKEILALRVKIKGRVNRWRRTKYIVGTRGTLPLQTISERIEQGTAQAINRKGAVGIRIWVRYKPGFLFQLNNHFLTFIKYSGLAKFKRKRIHITLKQ